MELYHACAAGETVRVNLDSPAGGYTTGSRSFFRYIVRLAELGLPLERADQEAVNILASIPHAFEEEGEVSAISGSGWRLVPPQGALDWPVLEATPERLRSALERAQGVLWEHAARVALSAGEMSAIEEELDAVYGVLQRAQAAGVPVNVSYVV
jgi:hypothetical protein